MAAVIVQDSFRYRNDDGSEAAATWVYALNTDGDLKAHYPYRFRFLVKNTGDAALNNIDFEFQYNLNGAGWVNITTTSSVVRAFTSVNITNDADCTQQLGAGTFHANNNGVTTDGTSGGAVLDLAAANETETELSMFIVGEDVVDGDTIQLRLTRDGGTLLGTYTRTPSITVDITGPVVKESATASGTSTNTVTTGNLTGGTNQFYAVWIESRNPGTVSTVTGGGLTWTQAKYQCAGRNQIGVAVWTAYGSPAAPFGVVVTMTGTIGSLAAVAVRVSGVDSVTPTEDVVGQNTVAENDTGCTGGTDSTTPALTTGATAAASLHLAGLARRVSNITNPDYFQHAAATAGAGAETVNLTVHSLPKGATGDDTFNPVLSATNDWATVGFIAVVASLNQTINVGAATMALAGQTVSVQPGAVSVGVQSATMGLAGQNVTVTSVFPGQTINVGAAVMDLAGHAAAVVPGAVAIAVSVAQMLLEGLGVSIVGQEPVGPPPQVDYGVGRGARFITKFVRKPYRQKRRRVPATLKPKGQRRKKRKGLKRES